MENAARLRRAVRAVEGAIRASRGLPIEEAFELVRDAALVARLIMTTVADEIESVHDD